MFVILIIVIISLWGIMSYNHFVKLTNDAKEAFSTMDVYLKKRFDLIPNLIESIKGYTHHEKSTLENVINTRNKIANAQNISEKIDAENALTNQLKSLFALSENYPDLKANQNFLNLQNQLNQIENDIVNSRKYYNGAVKKLNTACETFPSLLVAKLFHFNSMPMYQIINDKERQNIKVKF